jgi:hypothetical protein
MSENLDPLGKVTEDKDLLGKIRGFLSGFIGYFERDQRREADMLLRETVAQRYEEQWERISSLQRDMIKASQLEYVDDLEAAAVKLRAFIDRVKGASHGYAGIFDHVRINSDELKQLYEYDLALLENVDRISHAIDNVNASLETEGLPAALRNLETVSQEAVDAFNRRDELLLSQ